MLCSTLIREAVVDMVEAHFMVEVMPERSLKLPLIHLREEVVLLEVVVEALLMVEVLGNNHNRLCIILITIRHVIIVARLATLPKIVTRSRLIRERRQINTDTMLLPIMHMVQLKISCLL